MAQVENKKITTENIKVSAAPKKVANPKKIETKPVEKTVEMVKTEHVAVKTVNYSHSNLKVSPRKLRLLANDIKKFTPADAVVRLKFVNSNAARQFLVVLKNAIASAKNNYQLNPSTLKFHEVRVDEGSKIKRMDKSHGSHFARGIIQKRHSRLSIVLSGTIQS